MIQIKEGKMEGERSNLCKIWDGSGLSSTLKTGFRGFEKSSLSMAVAIQPHPFLQSMYSLAGVDDGFIDRLLVTSTWPRIVLSHDRLQGSRELKEMNGNIFGHIMKCIYYDHKNGITYNFCKGAQEYYDDLCDQFAAEYNEDNDPNADKDFGLNTQGRMYI